MHSEPTDAAGTLEDLLTADATLPDAATLQEHTYVELVYWYFCFGFFLFFVRTTSTSLLQYP
jgi:hypothetical protein